MLNVSLTHLQEGFHFVMLNSQKRSFQCLQNYIEVQK